MMPGNPDVSGARRGAEPETCQNCESGILVPVRNKPGWRECKTCGNWARDDRSRVTAPSLPDSYAKMPAATATQIKMQRSAIRERLQSVKAGDACPHCGKAKIIASEGGELDCPLCGFVVSQSGVDQGPEWRSFPEDGGRGDATRTGAAISITKPDMGLAATIGKNNVDYQGKALGPEVRSRVERLRRWDKRSPRTPMDRNLGEAFLKLGEWADKLAASTAVVERASYIYRKALDRGLVRGRSISQMVAASLVFAFRKELLPRTLKEVATASDLRRKDVSRCYRLLLREIDIRVEPPDSTKCVAKIANKLGISEKTRRRTLDILRRAAETRMQQGKDPMAWAAAALYVACVVEDETRTQKRIAEAAGVTEVTVRNRYRNLQSFGKESGQDGPPVASKKHAKEITAPADRSVPEVKDAVHEEAVQATSDDVQMMLRDASKRWVAATASAVQMSMEVEDSAMDLLDSVDFEKLPPESGAMQVAMAASYAAALGRDADAARKIVERAGMSGQELLQVLTKTHRGYTPVETNAVQDSGQAEMAAKLHDYTNMKTDVIKNAVALGPKTGGAESKVVIGDSREDLLDSIANMVGAGWEARKRALELLRRDDVIQMGEGRNRKGFIASVLHAADLEAGKQSISLADLAYVAGVMPETISATSSKIRRMPLEIGG